MSSANEHGVTGSRLADRASSVPVPPGIASQNGRREAGADVVPPDLTDVESVLRAVAELTGMPPAPPDHNGQTARAILRSQPARIVDGLIEGGYTSEFEVICRDCGDNPYLDYSAISPRLQRLRGPYTLREGCAAYVAHVDMTTHGVGHEPAQCSPGQRSLTTPLPSSMRHAIAATGTRDTEDHLVGLAGLVLLR